MTAPAGGRWFPRLRTHGLLVLVASVTVLLALSATMINVALPVIVRDLGATASESTWMLLSYLIVHACTLVPSGQVSDGGDKRRMFLAGLALFVVGSVALVVAGDPVVFIVARAVQGLAAALLLSNAAAILAWTYSGAGLGRAMGIYLAGFAVAQASGPVLGGVLASTVGWRWMFVVTVAVGLVSLTAGYRLLRRLPPAPAARGPRVDVPGSLLLALSLSAGLLGLSLSQRSGWGDLAVIGLLVVSVLVLPVLWRVERDRVDPAVDRALLSHPVFGPVNVAAMLLNVPRVVPIVLISLWFQGVQGMTTPQAGLLVTSLPVGVALGSVASGRVTGARGDRELGYLSALASAAACTLLVPALLWGPPAAIAVVLLGVGLSTGVYSTASATTLIRVAPRAKVASVNGIRTTFQLVGLAGGTAALLSVVVGGLDPAQATAFMAGQQQALTAESVAGLRHGYLIGFSAVAALAWVAALLSWRVRGVRAPQW